LEQVLAIMPSHAEAFGKLESLLAVSGDGLRLADFYAAAALHKPDKGEQLALLRRAAEITDSFSAEHERAIRIYQRIFRLDPSGARARPPLACGYGEAGKFRDAAGMLEPVIAPPGERSDAVTLNIRELLIGLCVGEIGEPDRPMPHVEELLGRDAGHELA